MAKSDEKLVEIDVTEKLQPLQAYAVSRRRAEIPQNVRSMASGLSEHMGCSVTVKSLTITDDRSRLTLELSENEITHPKAEVMIKHLKQCPVVLARPVKNLVVIQGNHKFTDDCGPHVVSILSGLTRDYFHEIELTVVPVPENTNGKRGRHLAD